MQQKEGHMKALLYSFAALLFCVTFVSAHCEIPCGIYDDAMRIELIEEHIQTIEKSMEEINKLSGEEEKNYNQIVRWTTNKEKHAELLQEIVCQYFLSQRIAYAPPTDAVGYTTYTESLILLHQMLVTSMKAKQTTKSEHVVKLRALLQGFKKMYFHNGQEK